MISEYSRLLKLTAFADPVFDTGDFSMLLHALVRMSAPEVIVELGTGLGISSLWMALAAKQNKTGHIWTVDDHSFIDAQSVILDETNRFLQNELHDCTPIKSSVDFFQQLAEFVGVKSAVTFIRRRIAIDDPAHFEDYPFATLPIDLLFSDFKTHPLDLIRILGQMLPRLSPAASVFLHSASTRWPSYLLLETLVSQLNEGHIPAALQERSTHDLRLLMQNRRVQLVHLTVREQEEQNSAAWLKFEPIDLFPQPRTRMHGVR